MGKLLYLNKQTNKQTIKILIYSKKKNYRNLTPSTIHLDKSGHICLTRFSFLLEGCTLPDDICTTGKKKKKIIILIYDKY